MKNEQKIQGKWEKIKPKLKERWNLSNNDLVQASGIPELASLIANRVGEPRPNILHELIHLVRTIDQDHPLLKDYFENTMVQGDDGSKLVHTDVPQEKSADMNDRSNPTHNASH